MEASVFYEKLRELQIEKRSEHKCTTVTLGERAGLFNFAYDTVDTIECKLNELMSKFIN